MNPNTGPRNFVHRSPDLKSEISDVNSGQRAQKIRNAYDWNSTCARIAWSNRLPDDMEARDSLMTTERLRDLYRAQPFRPFVIHLADGREKSQSRIANSSPSDPPAARSLCISLMSRSTS
jgi:hypothetical protein